MVGVGRLTVLAVVVNVEAGVVVFDGGKAAVLEDTEGTGTEMLIDLLGDGEVEMDDDVAPEAATEPPWADTFGDLTEANNLPVTLPTLHQTHQDRQGNEGSSSHAKHSKGAPRSRFPHRPSPYLPLVSPAANYASSHLQVP